MTAQCILHPSRLGHFKPFTLDLDPETEEVTSEEPLPKFEKSLVALGTDELVMLGEEAKLVASCVEELPETEQFRLWDILENPAVQTTEMVRRSVEAFNHLVAILLAKGIQVSERTLPTLLRMTM